MYQHGGDQQDQDPDHYLLTGLWLVSAILTAMIRNAAFAALLLLPAAASFAGAATGLVSVQITLTDPRNTTGNNNACTSASGSSAGSASVRVRCNTDVFVNIAQVNLLGNARFLTGYRPARDSLLPDYCRNEMARGNQAARFTCRLDDSGQLATAGDEADDGWEVENRRYAMGPEAAAVEKQARLRLQDEHGTLTALRLVHAGHQSRSIEMLVSF
jgi:hypothetical protein